MRALLTAVFLVVAGVSQTTDDIATYTGPIQVSPCVTATERERYSFVPEEYTDNTPFFVPCSYITPYAYPKEWYNEGQEV
jgi:hypothetical protein